MAARHATEQRKKDCYENIKPVGTVSYSFIYLFAVVINLVGSNTTYICTDV